MFYHLGPWEWRADDETGPRWLPPKGTVALRDLRPYAACAAKTSHPLNFGFFACKDKLGSSYLDLGTSLEAQLTTAQRDGWCQTTGMPSLVSRKLMDVLAETLTVKSDPEQLRRVQGMRPNRGKFTLRFAKQTIWTRRFEGMADPAWLPLQKALWQDFIKNFDIDHLSPEEAKAQNIVIGDPYTHRRLLTDWMQRYGIADWREFVPQDLVGDVEGPLPKHTALAENWNCGDSASINCQLTWTELMDKFAISGNKCVDVADSSGAARARAESDLSSDAHYCDATLTGLNGASQGGLAVRFASGADTCYVADLNVNNGLEKIHKIVAGGATEILACSGVSGYPARITVDADDLITYTDGGANTDDVTDSSITGNTRIGIHSYVWEIPTTFDTLTAEDLAAAYVPYPLSARGASGGLSTLAGGLAAGGKA